MRTRSISPLRLTADESPRSVCRRASEGGLSDVGEAMDEPDSLRASSLSLAYVLHLSY